MMEMDASPKFTKDQAPSEKTNLLVSTPYFSNLLHMKEEVPKGSSSCFKNVTLGSYFSNSLHMKEEVPEGSSSCFNNVTPGSYDISSMFNTQHGLAGRQEELSFANQNIPSQNKIGLYSTLSMSNTWHLPEDVPKGSADSINSEETKFNYLSYNLSIPNFTYLPDVSHGIPNNIPTEISNGFDNALCMSNSMHLREGINQGSPENIPPEKLNSSDNEYTLSTPNMIHLPEKEDHQKKRNFSEVDSSQDMGMPNADCTDNSATEEGEKFKCNVCDRNYTRKKDLSRHTKKVHSREYPFACITCGHVYRYKSMLINHYLAKHDSKKKYTCSVCEEIFLHIRDLQSHLKEKHPDVNRPFQCDICKKYFKTMQNVHTHKQTHLKEKKYHCGICGHNFSKPSCLKIHLRAHFKEVLKSNPEASREQRYECEKMLKESLGIPLDYKCDICGNGYSSKYTLNIHKSVHTKEFKCEFCDLQFTNNSTLQRHRRIHTGETSYQCDVCGTPWNSLKDLKIHSVVHTGERPFKCYVCQKSFSFKSSLNAHLKIHSGEKNYYTCDVCTKEFTTSYTLTVHKRIHSGERNFKCDMCEKTFYTNGNLRTHKKHAHEKKRKKSRK